MDSSNEAQNDWTSTLPWSTPYSVHYVNLDFDTQPKDNADVITFLAVASNLDIPLLPFTWQPYREQVGHGASGDVREALVDTKTSLAFKLVKGCDKVHTKSEITFRVLLNELTVLSQPQIREHPHIVKLLGVAWDVSQTSQVWPALVFEKSHFGSIYHFSTLPAWEELKVPERLDLCLQIGSAIAEMHHYGIVHGDIKPENVLIFKKNNGSYVAQIIDFAFSCRFRTNMSKVSLPRSPPWNAPETDRLSRKFSFDEARRTDIFSYALLCLWILFDSQLTSRALSAKPPDALQNIPPSVRFLIRLKRNDSLIQSAVDLLAADERLESYKEALESFFNSTLVSEPTQRIASLELSSLVRMHIETAPRPTNMIQDLSRKPDIDKFELANVLDRIYDIDPRVRSSILQCLERRDRTEPQASVLSSDRIQLALCYYIGIGRARDEQKMMELASNENDMARICEAIESLKKRATRKATSHDMIQQILRAGHGPNLHPDEAGYSVEKFRETEQILRRELDDMKSSLDDLVCKRKIEYHLFLLLVRQRKFNEAEFRLRHALSTRLMVSDPDDPELTVSTRLGIPYHDDLKLLPGLFNLAWIFLERGQLSEALKLQQKGIQILSENLEPEHPLMLTAKGNLAAILFQLGQWHEAEALEQELWAIRRRDLGDDHPDTLTGMCNLTAILRKRGKLADAEALGRKVMSMVEKVFGLDHPDALRCKSSLGLIYQGMGQLDAAEHVQDQVLERSRALLGPENLGTLMEMSNLALTYWYQKRLSKAEELGSEVVRLRKELLGNGHPDTMTSVANLALVYKDLGQLQKAVVWEEEVLDNSRALLGNEHPDTLLSMHNLAQTYGAIEAWDKAASLQEEMFETSKRVNGEKHPETVECAGNLGFTYLKLGRSEDFQRLGVRLVTAPDGSILVMRAVQHGSIDA